MTRHPDAGYAVENLVEQIRQRATVLVAHDAVHPDRDECGGVGACRLMMAEVEAKDDVVQYLDMLARCGVEITLDPVDPTTLRARKPVRVLKPAF